MTRRGIISNISEHSISHRFAIHFLNPVTEPQKYQQTQNYKTHGYETLDFEIHDGFKSPEVKRKLVRQILPGGGVISKNV